jgi:hypothetical protein
MMRLKTLVAAALFLGGAAFATAGGASAGAMPVPQLDTAGVAEQGPLVQVHKRKYKHRHGSRASRYCYNNPWDCQPRRRYARRCHYDYYGDLVCHRRYGYRPRIPFFWGFGFGF